MIDHSGIQVSDIAKARAFYEACFAALDASQMMEVPKEYTGGVVVVGYGRDKPDFWVSEALPVRVANETSAASRPTPIRTRPLTGASFVGSNKYHWPSR